MSDGYDRLEAWLHALIHTAPGGVWTVAWLMRDLEHARGVLRELEHSRVAAEGLTVALYEAIDALREPRP
jgi:hypothetical protein